jgi:hypothetical protein
VTRRRDGSANSRGVISTGFEITSRTGALIWQLTDDLTSGDDSYETLPTRKERIERFLHDLYNARAHAELELFEAEQLAFALSVLQETRATA